VEPQRLFDISDQVPVLRDLDGMAPLLRSMDRSTWRRHQHVWRTARTFAREAIWPNALAYEQAMDRDPWYVDTDFLVAAGQAGLLSMSCFRSLGGLGLGATAASLVMEELCAGCAGLANLIGAHHLGLIGLLLSTNLGLSARIQREVVAGARTGRPVLLAAAVTEPLAGSDVEDTRFMATARIGCVARREPGGYRLSGSKVFISNGSFARYVMVAAALDRKRPLETWTMFMVDSTASGFSVPRVEHKMGMKANPAAELHLDEVFVPDSDVVSAEVGDGMAGTEVVLGASRGPVAAIATGIARGAVERFLHFATVTERDGRPLIADAGIQEAVASALQTVGLCRSTYLNGALCFDRHGHGVLTNSPMIELFRLPFSGRLAEVLSRTPAGRARIKERLDAQVDPDGVDRTLAAASLAKAACSELALDVISGLMDLMGPAALEPEWGLEKAWRDAKLTQIYEGTNQLNRLCLYERGVGL